ncbi:hypothetical protein OGAPHI_006086 [Ogataea philodendri]|uniref:Uncharacterized protein n=1 Tax=Ogataea philodendri TaxID=1378263 RepID=A0A9P8NYI2_9ASCO|nr:uncharacterized protein OGAPHI_006086 [Ogataea philodendri]KAH3661907.1 hypothetical protein OGAPHI_006086 [Ogataea philodendri]
MESASTLPGVGAGSAGLDEEESGAFSAAKVDSVMVAAADLFGDTSLVLTGVAAFLGSSVETGSYFGDASFSGSVVVVVAAGVSAFGATVSFLTFFRLLLLDKGRNFLVSEFDLDFGSLALVNEFERLFCSW